MRIGGNHSSGKPNQKMSKITVIGKVGQNVSKETVEKYVGKTIEVRGYDLLRGPDGEVEVELAGDVFAAKVTDWKFGAFHSSGGESFYWLRLICEGENLPKFEKYRLA